MNYKPVLIVCFLLTSCGPTLLDLTQTNYDKNPVVFGTYTSDINGHSKLIINPDSTYVDTLWDGKWISIDFGKVRIEHASLFLLADSSLSKKLKPNKQWEKDDYSGMDEDDRYEMRTRHEYLFMNGMLYKKYIDKVLKYPRYTRVS